MTSQVIPILLFVAASLVGALGQVFYKKGSSKIASDGFFTWELWGGCFLFCLVMILFVVAYKMGGKVSIVYPFYGLTFIWGAYFSQKYLNESVNGWQWVGIFLVCFGSMLVAFYGQKGAG